ncbi:hypothetical protein [Enterococcus raffinosus]|uniref:hypothetical protein n=1 Tax=Enterococcus raffinosus TaxID=71452 RepID=UPI001C9450B3|nr:hypothetical protein [Enterococcus raffinosus]MDT2531725.1 hypothetical protein [Enterococcus raffinosus]QZO07890.1 hypothetical protein K5P74_08285 [Enterococcus raffinosus]
MKSMIGLVSKVKILKYSERPLVFFKLDDVSCLIAGHSLNFLADVEDGMRIAVAGEYNSRKQFIVRKYSVIGETRIMLELNRLSV